MFLEIFLKWGGWMINTVRSYGLMKWIKESAFSSTRYTISWEKVKNQNQKGYQEEVLDLVENQTLQSHQNQKYKLMRKTESK